MVFFCRPAVMPVDLHIPSIIAQSRRESAWESARSVLTVAQTCRVLCALSSSVDSLFEQAAEKLTLRALVHFMRELCKASDEQLRTRGKCEDEIVLFKIAQLNFIRETFTFQPMPQVVPLVSLALVLKALVAHHCCLIVSLRFSCAAFPLTVPPFTS